jgi:hypothetical protein
MGTAVKVYMGTESDEITYLAGKDYNGDSCIIITDTWRFHKICKTHKSLQFPFYILQFDGGSLVLLRKESFNNVPELS